MKGILIIVLSAIFTLSFGIESYIYARPSEQIRINSQNVSGSIASEYGSNQVYAQFRNYTNSTVSISWSILATDASGNTVVVASDKCSVGPNKTHKTARYSKKNSLSNYRLEWSKN